MNRPRRKFRAGRATGRIFKSSLILAFIYGLFELAAHTGVEEIVKEKLQDWHDKMNVEVGYDSRQQLKVVDVRGILNDDSLVSSHRVALNDIKDSKCRPDWDGEDRFRFKGHCASPIANKITSFQDTLPANGTGRRSLKKLWNRMKQIEAGSKPDSYFVELKKPPAKPEQSEVRNRRILC
jgi:hypothetical protein